MRSKCRDLDLDHSEMEVLVVVVEELVWTNETSVKEEGKGSRVGNQEGGPTNLPRPVLILPPHQPGGHLADFPAVFF